jgi:glycosyltransferase involved in cell wall biosynthesis
MKLTIGIPVYDDYDGVFFTVMALRMYHDLNDTEILIVDSFGCKTTENFVKSVGGRYVRLMNRFGPAAAKGAVFTEAKGDFVLCCDCHVLFAPAAIMNLRNYFGMNPECKDLIQGPLLYDDLKYVATHFKPIWRGEMYGIWSDSVHVNNLDNAPFEIPMQGMGVFSCKKSAWLGFNPKFRGFGGEEGYIHEKFRQAGRKCVCLPWLQWAHRFNRPYGMKYPVRIEDKIFNYVVGHVELGLDIAPVIEHFSEFMPREAVMRVVKEALGPVVQAGTAAALP